MSRFLAFTREPGSRPPGSSGPESPDRSGDDADPLLSFNAEGEDPAGAEREDPSDTARLSRPPSDPEPRASDSTDDGTAVDASAPGAQAVETSADPAPAVARRAGTSESPGHPAQVAAAIPAASTVAKPSGIEVTRPPNGAAAHDTVAHNPARGKTMPGSGAPPPPSVEAWLAHAKPAGAAEPVPSAATTRFALGAYAWVWFFAAFALLAVAIAASRFPFPGSRAAAAVAVVPPTGTASFDSRPAGAEVRIDGVSHGVTPVKLSLAPGQHTVEFRSGDAVRSLPLTIEPGATVSQYVEFVAAAVPAAGRLEVVSDPPGAQVRIDGEVRGVTPLSLDSVAPGNRAIVVSSGATIVRRSVTVAAGATANVAVSIAASEHAAGWVAWKTPFEMDVFQDGNLLGTTNIDRLMLPAGRHQLELVNDAYGFRSRVAVQVQAGQTTTPAVSIPEGSLSINALPWAEVFVDGRPAGTTPLGNLSVSIGQHEIVWRHPELGERRQTVAVTANTPARIGVDLTK